MKRAVITGLGFITSIGNNREEVTMSLKEVRTGVEPYAEFSDPSIPVKLLGTIKDFSFPTEDFEDWTYPAKYKISRETMRPMTPNALYAYFAMREAIEDAGLNPDQVSNPNTGLMCGSGGSMMMAYKNIHTLNTRGVQKCLPMSIINGIPGSLYINLVPTFRILGSCMGVSSACASSAHALGLAFDEIRLGRQKRVFVVGSEDGDKVTVLPFAAVRALSTQQDPAKSPCAFDKKRDGFVGTGGAAVLIVEELETALARNPKNIYAEVLGWGQAADGYNVLAPDPTGQGLARAMEGALRDAQLEPHSIDYINAHAPSTPFGDAAEIAAIKRVFSKGHVPNVSSTKSLTGHGLSLAGAMEAGFCCVALKEKFTPVSAHITELDPVCEGIPIVTKPISEFPKTLMNNSSGFGGTNVSVIMNNAESLS